MTDSELLLSRFPGGSPQLQANRSTGADKVISKDRQVSGFESGSQASSLDFF